MSTIISLIAEGDSITYTTTGYVYRGFEVGTNSIWTNVERYGSRFHRTTSTPKIVGHVIAVSGSTLANHMTARLTTRLPALIGAAKSNSAGTRKILLTLLAGTNPDTSNPNTHLANVATYVAAAKALGVDKVIVGTLPSRTDGIIASFDTSYQQPINTAYRDASWRASANVDGYFDCAADPEVGAAGAANNTTNFNADKIHPITPAQILMAARYMTGVDAVAATMV